MPATPTSSARPSTAHAESEPYRAQPRQVVGLCPDRVVLNARSYRGGCSDLTAICVPFGTGWMENSAKGPAISRAILPTPRVLHLAMAAYLARFKGQSRIHTESDLRGYIG